MSYTMAFWMAWAFLEFYFWESILGLIAVLQLGYASRQYILFCLICIHKFILGIKTVILNPRFFLRLSFLIVYLFCINIFQSASISWFSSGGYSIDNLTACLTKKEKKKDDDVRRRADDEGEVRKSSKCTMFPHP